MTTGKEGSSNIPDEETSLTPKEVEGKAFSLINEFEGTLGGLEEFRTALEQAYFGSNNVADSQQRIRVDFGKGDSHFTATSTFTKDTRTLIIKRKTVPSEKGLMVETVILESRREAVQKTDPQALIMFIENSQGPSVREVDSKVALQKAEEILASLRSSS